MKQNGIWQPGGLEVPEAAAIGPSPLKTRQEWVASLGAQDRLLRGRMIVRSRTHFDTFMETVAKDDDGLALIQARLHETWSQFIAYCRRCRRHALIMAPFGHGKTIQFCGLCAYLIGRKPTVRIKVVSNTADLAADRVSLVRRMIEKDLDYQEVFPHIVPVRDKLGVSGEEWRGSKFRVKHDGWSADPTMQAFGINARGAGRRGDFIWVDDPYDLETAVLKPAERPKVLQSIQNTWLSRLSSPHGMMVLTTTRWHEADAMGTLMENRGWITLVQEIRDDYSGIDSTIIMPGWGKTKLPMVPLTRAA